MELRQLQYFLTVAEEESFAKASKRIYISQQALSKSIMSLEQELGVSLFNRGSHGVTLTEEGMLLFNRAYTISRYVNDTVEEILDHKQNRSFHAVIAVSRGVENSANFLKILDFEKDNPGYTFSTIVTDDQKVEDLILDGKAELGIIGSQSNKTQLDFILLEKPPMYLAVNIESPLAKKDCVELTDLKNYKLLGSYEFYHFYNRLDTFCNAHGFTLQFSHRTENILYVTKLLEYNQGVFLCPNSDDNYFNHERIKLIPIKDSQIYLSCYLGFRKHRTLSNASRVMLDYMLNIYGVKNPLAPEERPTV